jgi:rubrerythrin
MNDKPSFITMLTNFAKAATGHIKAGLPQTSDEEKERRAAICESCDQLNKEEYRCNVCGCFLKYKISWADQTCPRDKWELKNEEIDDLDFD